MCNKWIAQFYLPPTHKPYLPLLPSRKASPPFGRYQIILLGEQRHIGVRNMPRVFTSHVPGRDSNGPTTSRSQVRHSTDSATTITMHRCSQDFLCGVHFFLDQKSDDLFSHHSLLRGPCTSYTATNYFLPRCIYTGRSSRRQTYPSVCPSVCLSVCLSVRLSVTRVNCDKKAPSEKSSIMTNRKSPTTLPMSLRL